MTGAYGLKQMVSHGIIARRAQSGGARVAALRLQANRGSIRNGRSTLETQFRETTMRVISGEY